MPGAASKMLGVSRATLAKHHGEYGIRVRKLPGGFKRKYALDDVIKFRERLDAQSQAVVDEVQRNPPPPPRVGRPKGSKKHQEAAKPKP